MREEPSIGSIETTHARLRVDWFPRSQTRLAAFDKLREVFGVNGGLPAATGCFLQGEAGVLAPALIQEVDVPIRACSPNQSRKCFDDTPEFVLRGGFFLAVLHSVKMHCSSTSVYSTLVLVGAEQKERPRQRVHRTLENQTRHGIG